MLRGKELSSNKTFLWNSTAVMNQCKRKGRLAYTIHLGGRTIYRLGFSWWRKGVLGDDDNGQMNER